MVNMIEFTVDPSQVEAFLGAKAELIVDSLRGELRGEMLNLLSYIKDEKLSGQLLHQRSGNLKNSGFTETTETPETLLGSVSFGRTAPYAAIHNYGGAINVPEVTGKLMVFQRDGAKIFTQRHKAFTVQMPARNYMETSLEEKQPEIVAGLQGAVDKAVAS